MSILIESLIEAMDEYYSVNLSEEVVRGMTEKFSRGKPVSIPPIGYKIKDGEFYIDEETAPIIRKIYNDYLNGKAYREIAMDLNAHGFKTRKGNNFSNRTVQYIIDNPVYAGYIRWDLEGRGSRGYYRDGKEMIIKASHEPIISEETYEQIKEKRKLEKSKSIKYERKSPVKNDFALRSLVKCSACGGNLCMSQSKVGLQCYKYAHGECNESHYISLNKINDAILQALKDDIGNVNINVSVRNNNIKPSFDYDKLIKREESKFIRIKEAYQSGVDTLEEYQQNKNIITAEINRLKFEQQKVLAETPKFSQTDIQHKLKTAVDLLESPIATETEKNLALKSFVDKIIFDRKTNTLTLYYFM